MASVALAILRSLGNRGVAAALGQRLTTGTLTGVLPPDQSELIAAFDMPHAVATASAGGGGSTGTSTGNSGDSRGVLTERGGSNGSRGDCSDGTAGDTAATTAGAGRGGGDDLAAGRPPEDIADETAALKAAVKAAAAAVPRDETAMAAAVARLKELGAARKMMRAKPPPLSCGARALAKHARRGAERFWTAGEAQVMGSPQKYVEDRPESRVCHPAKLMVALCNSTLAV
jgi:hypothetical protein